MFATWIPNVDWQRAPWFVLAKIANIYLHIFEKIVPGWGCVIGIIVFRLLQNYLSSFA
jgi:uncharacterized protein YggT (Ycf19 family)